LWTVIYDLYFTGTATWFVYTWFAISLVMLHRVWLGYRFNRREMWLDDPRRRQRIAARTERFAVTTLVTCAKEEPEIFELAMQRLRNQKELDEHIIYVMMDAFDDPSDDDNRCLAIAERYADRVYLTNVRDKRINLDNLFRLAKEAGQLRDFVALMDSDTICDHPLVMALLRATFEDPVIGGATTAQRVYRCNTIPERVSDWLENARLKSSMAAGALYQQVGCLPGRLYMVRRVAVEERIPDLPNEVWRGNCKPRWPTLRNPWPFESWAVVAKAGDDRQITNFVFRAGYQTTLVPTASIKTLVPDNYRKLWKTWRRWGTSSQGYVFRAFDVLRRNPFVLYHYVTDIIISHVSVGLVLSWMASFFISREELLFPLTSMLALSFLGVMATFVIRQAPHLRQYPKDILLLPHFVVIVTIAQFIRVYACWTPWQIGTWGTRSGVDDEVRNTWVREHL
jgi:cellulose synthase/poly-beta-1,6-N-acetylglucosamine synthase-like glycosyltransferase